MSDFDSAFELSYKLVIVPEWDPPDRGEGTDIERFPWLLGVGDVEGIKIRRSVTVYRARTDSLRKIG